MWIELCHRRRRLNVGETLCSLVLDVLMHIAGVPRRRRPRRFVTSFVGALFFIDTLLLVGTHHRRCRSSSSSFRANITVVVIIGTCQRLQQRRETSAPRFSDRRRRLLHGRLLDRTESNPVVLIAITHRTPECCEPK